MRALPFPVRLFALLLLLTPLAASAQIVPGGPGGGTEPGSPGDPATPAGTAVIMGHVKTPDPAMIPTVMVFAMTPDSTATGMTIAVPDPDGAYRLEGLAAGTYIVGVRSPDHQPQFWPFVASMADAAPIELVDGQVVEGIDFALDFLPMGTGVISGRVVDDNGHVMGGVYLTAYDPSRADGGSGWAVSDADGSYTIRGLPAGNYLVRADAWGQWTSISVWYDQAADEASATSVALEDGAQVSGIDFVVSLTGGSASISGHVLALDGTPLPGAQVMVQSLLEPRDSTGSFVNAWTAADADGSWRVDGLPAGTYTLYASWWDGDRFGQVWHAGVNDPSLARAIVLADGEALSGYDLVIDVQSLYGSIGGTITDAATGLPIERALVQVHPLSADMSGAPIRFPDAHAVTGPDGRYDLGGLPAGAYLVSAYTEGGFAFYGGGWVTENAMKVEVDGGSSADVSFPVERRNDGDGRIEGRVAIDFNVGWADTLYSDPTLPPKIAVVEARPTAMIQVWPESERFYSTVVREDGTYVLDGLPAGEYIVSAAAPWFMPEYWNDTFDPAAAVPVVVDSALPSLGIDFLLVPWMFMDPAGAVRGGGATMHGQVVDEEGNPVPGATVYLLDADGNPVASTETAGDGTWAMPGVTRGHYRVMVTKEGYTRSYNDDARALDQAPPVENAGAGAEINVTLRNTSSTDVEPGSETPDAFTLLGNYPNPFNPVTTVQVSLPTAADVRIEVYDLLGRRVLEVQPGRFGAGIASLRVDASALPSGTYLYRVLATTQAGVQQAGGRMVLLK